MKDTIIPNARLSITIMVSPMPPDVLITFALVNITEELFEYTVPVTCLNSSVYAVTVLWASSRDVKKLSGIAAPVMPRSI